MRSLVDVWRRGGFFFAPFLFLGLQVRAARLAREIEEIRQLGLRDQSKKGSSAIRRDSFAGTKEKKMSRAVAVGMKI